MKSLFKITCIAAGAVFILLFVQFLFTTEDFIRGMGLTPDAVSIVLLRRTSVFVLGFAVLMLLSRDLPVSRARDNVCIAMAVLFSGFVINGSYGFLQGTYNSSIFVAIAIEFLLGLGFLVSYLINRKGHAGQ